MPYAINLSLLIAEAVLYFVVMTALFRLRHRFGIGVFFCALGTMHFLETYLAAIFYVQFPYDIFISPGSVVLFSGKLVMLLLVYIREDASTVRQPIYGLLLGNFLIVGFVAVLRYHEVVPASAMERLPDFRFMKETGWLMVWGTILLFIDSILIILLYERTRTWLGAWQFPRIALSAALVLAFDQLGFFAALYLYVGVPAAALVGGLIAKTLAALIFGGMATAYLRFAEPKTAVMGRSPRLSDVFDALTYRQRYEALLEEAGHDGLTGLLDRGRFDRECPPAVRGAVATGRPISLLVVDIDHFKGINDEYGHAVGDEALRRIAREMSLALRAGDRLYRYGGEEFVVLCEGLSHASAFIAADRLRRTIAATEIGGLPRPVTASIGVASAPEDGGALAELFATADARLYAAKEAGRDRVVGRPRPPRPEMPAGWSEKRQA